MKWLSNAFKKVSIHGQHVPYLVINDSSTSSAESALRCQGMSHSGSYDIYLLDLQKETVNTKYCTNPIKMELILQTYRDTTVLRETSSRTPKHTKRIALIQ